MRRLLTIVLGVMVLSCGFWVLRQSDEANASLQSKELGAVLEPMLAEQSAAWNRGDIPAFMKAYWNDPKMTFSSGGKTERGWQATLERYKKNYPDQKAMGKLTFSELETTQLDANVALMLGRWKLERDEPIAGNFSLVWKLTENGWKIVHDHSSSDKQVTN
jgi:beta-aspartyl-peptidase (threonine type)